MESDEEEQRPTFNQVNLQTKPEQQKSTKSIKDDQKQEKEAEPV